MGGIGTRSERLGMWTDHPGVPRVEAKSPLPGRRRGAGLVARVRSWVRGRRLEQGVVAGIGIAALVVMALGVAGAFSSGEGDGGGIAPLPVPATVTVTVESDSVVVSALPGVTASASSPGVFSEWLSQSTTPAFVGAVQSSSISGRVLYVTSVEPLVGREAYQPDAETVRTELTGALRVFLVDRADDVDKALLVDSLGRDAAEVTLSGGVVLLGDE